MVAKGTGNLDIIDGVMNARKYIEIFQHNLLQSAENHGLEKHFPFQQDNDPKHRQWFS